MTDKQRILAEMDLLKQQLLFIETAERMSNPIQEEPVSGNIDFEQELYKAFGQVKDFTLGMQIAKWFYDMGRNSKDSQEPVSENLEDYINELSKQFQEVSFAKLSRIAVRVSRWQQNQDVKNKLPKVINRTELDEYAYQCAYDMSNDWARENPTWKDVEDACKLGAQWQKEQFEKNRLKHCDSITNEQAELEQGFVDQHLDKHNRIPTFLDAIEYGMNLQKEQMMKDAIDATVHIDSGGYPYIPQIELYNYIKDVPLAKEGDKYKVVLIKEE